MLNALPAPIDAPPNESAIASNTSWAAGHHLDIQTIEATLDRLKTTLSGARELTIDLSQVTLIDTAGVQFLTVVTHHLRRLGVVLKCSGRSIAVDQAFQTLGLSATELLSEMK